MITEDKIIEKIKEKMIEKEITQTDLSKLLRVSRSTINRYLNGKMSMDGMTICRVCNILEIKVILL